MTALKVNRQRSRAYHSTVVNDEAGRERYEAIKKECREFNHEQRKIARETGTLPLVKKVDCFARLGPNSPHAQKYKDMNKNWRKNAYHRIAREDGATLDIYVNLCKKVVWNCGFVGLRSIA